MRRLGSATLGPWSRAGSSGTAGWGESANVLRMDDLGKEDTRSTPPNLTPTSEPTLTRKNLDWADRRLARPAGRVRKDDVVVIYFAGQAVAKTPRAKERPNGRAYLLPIDARGRETLSGDRMVRSTMRSIRPGGSPKTGARVVLWLDTSPYGRGQGGTCRPSRARPTGLRNGSDP